MDEDQFQRMWENMQAAGYFDSHPHYSADLHPESIKDDIDIDRQVSALDFAAPEIVFPVPYSDALERSVKRLEAFWLPRLFGLPSSGPVLDLGCGYGRTLKWLARQYPEVVGVDISRSAITAATEHLRGFDNVRLYVNEASHLPEAFSAQSFQWVYAFTVFQHMPREYTHSLLNDIHRVLKTEGCVIFNLLSGINEQENQGVSETEWAIGYAAESIEALLRQTGFRLGGLRRWCGPESPVAWLWVLAEKRQ